MNQSFCVVVVSTHEGGTLAREMDPFFRFIVTNFVVFDDACFHTHRQPQSLGTRKR
jgi:hypothetical protein